MKANPLSANSRSSNIDEVTDGELLELLLQYCGAASVSKAQELLMNAGNIANLLDAPPTLLAERHGLDDKTVTLIRLVSELHRRYLLIRSRSDVFLRVHTAIARYLMPLFAGEKSEILYLLSLNGARMVLGCTRLNNGNLNRVDLDIRSLIRDAIDKNASYVVLAHNHPSGMGAPSSEDINTTNAVRDLLTPLGITLLDHMIFANDNYLSMRECGYFLF